MLGKEFESLHFIVSKSSSDRLHESNCIFHSAVVLESRVDPVIDILIVEVSVFVPERSLTVCHVFAKIDHKVDNGVGRRIRDHFVDEFHLFDLVKNDAACFHEDLERPVQRHIVIGVEMDHTVFVCTCFQDGRQSDIGIIAHKVDHRIHCGRLNESPIGTKKFVCLFPIKRDLCVVFIPFQDFVMKDAEFLPGEAFCVEETHSIFEGIHPEAISSLDDLFGLVAIHHDEFGTGNRFIAQVGRGELYTGFPCIEEDTGHFEVGRQDIDIKINDPEVNIEAEVNTAKGFFIADITGPATVLFDFD